MSVKGIKENKCLEEIKIDIESLKTEIMKATLELAYPIGKEYVTQENINPATILGFGTWERIKGKVLVGLDEADLSFNEIGKEGGTSSYTLSKAQLPKYDLKVTDTHQHYLLGNAEDSGDGTGLHETRRLGSKQTAGATKGTGVVNYIGNDSRDNRTYGTGAYFYTEKASMGAISVSSDGGEEEIDNLTPYKVVGYMWIRTA